MSPQQIRSQLLEEVRLLEAEFEARRSDQRHLPRSVMLAYRRAIAAKYDALRSAEPSRR